MQIAEIGTSEEVPICGIALLAQWPKMQLRATLTTLRSLAAFAFEVTSLAVTARDAAEYTVHLNGPASTLSKVCAAVMLDDTMDN